MTSKALPAQSPESVIDTIESIPVAMRRMGWSVSAALMDRWIRSPAWVLPTSLKGPDAVDARSLMPSHVDTSTVRMSWAMKHARVNTSMTALRARLSNEATKRVLRLRFVGLQGGTDGRLRIGTRSDNAIHLEKTCQANYEPVGSKWSTMDDFYGGLGLATLKVALIGELQREPRTRKLTFRATDAGFYIRDTYDFNGPQYLGSWSTERVQGKFGMLMNAVSDATSFGMAAPSRGHVGNHHFDAYRKATGRGGDFVIYSDVYWESINLQFELG